MYSQLVCMGSRELCHDRHTVTLLTDHTVFSPKQTREILVEKKIVLALDGIIHKTCEELNIEIIELLKSRTNKFQRMFYIKTIFNKIIKTVVFNSP